MTHVYENDKPWTERTAGPFTAWTIIWIVVDFCAVTAVFYFV